ncbi:MAG: sulfotransferase [Pikeienuella sp.]
MADGYDAFVEDAVRRFDACPMFLCCVGMPKAGTTWLARTLENNADLAYSPPEKEVDYWNNTHGGAPSVRPRMSRRRFRAARTALNEAVKGGARPAKLERLRRRVYRARTWFDAFHGDQVNHRAYKAFLGSGLKDHNVVCDISPNYADLSPEVIGEITKVHHNTHVFVMLRDPMAWRWSYARHTTKGEKVLASRGLPADWTAYDELRAYHKDPSRGRYRIENSLTLLDGLERHVPDGRGQVLFFESLFHEDSVRELGKYLNVEIRDVNFDVKHNKGVDLKLPPRSTLNAGYRQLAPIYNALGERLKGALPSAWGSDDAFAF